MTDVQKYPHYAGLALMIFGILFAANETFHILDVGTAVTVLGGIASLLGLGWLVLNLGKLVDVDALAPNKPH